MVKIKKIYKMLNLPLIILAIYCFAFKAFAEIPERLLYNRTTITPSISFEGEEVPKHFAKGNNLSIKTGNYYFAEGEPLVFEGTIVDINDVPIEGALVQIWQTNSRGFYQFNRTEEDPLNDKNFNDSGSVVTDSLGRFQFITIMPAGYSQTPDEIKAFFEAKAKILSKNITKTDSEIALDGAEEEKIKEEKKFYNYRKRSPHINVIVTKDGFTTLQTQVFFSMYSNALDYYFAKLLKPQRDLLTAKMYYIDSRDRDLGKRAVFNIKLDGIQRFKYY